MDKGAVGDIQWLKERTGLSKNSLDTKILIPFKNELVGIVANNQGGRGKPLKVNKYRFGQWLDENFERIDW